MNRFLGLCVAAGLAAVVVSPGVVTGKPPADTGGTVPERVAVRIPERIVPLTRKHLAMKVPQFYAFQYDAEPQPGKRYWLRVDATTWVERYPDGLQSTFKVLGHTTVNDTEGTLVVKVTGDSQRTGTDNKGGLQAFIPDKGSAIMHHWYRNIDRGDMEWNDLGPMLNVE